MGGLGARFAQAGFTLPKPLIPVDGKPMFLKALSSLEGWDAPRRHTAVLRREHQEQFRLGTLLREALPTLEVLLLEEMTRGAVETCLAAAPRMAGDAGLLVLDCDLWFHSRPYAELVQASLADPARLAGGLLTFAASDPRYSYAQVDSAGRVMRTAEKVVISDRAIAGAYYFATESHFLRVARRLLDEPLGPEMKEYYLSYLYNLLLEEGGVVHAAPIQGYASFGTPEELERYQAERAR
jgi:dTDP-glucose pyrophosphorylase